MSSKSRAWKSLVGAIIICAVVNCLSQVVVLALGQICVAYESAATEVTIFFTTFALGAFVICLFIGKLIEKFGPKTIITIGIILTAIAYIAVAVSSSIYVLWIAGILAGIALAATGPVILQTIISVWFTGSVGTLIGTGMMVSVLPSVIFAPIFANFCLTNSFRFTLLWTAIGGCTIMLLCNIFLVNKTPDAYGLKPFPITMKAKKEKTATTVPLQTIDLAMPMSRLMKMPIIYLAFLCPIFLNFVLTMISSNATLIYSGMGLTATGAAYCVSLATAAAMLISPIFGVLSDRFTPKVPVIAFTAISFLICASFSLMHGWIGAIIIAVFGVSGSVNQYFGSIVMPALVGPKKGTTMIGWCTAASAIGSMFAAPVCAALAAANGGSYTVSFFLGAVLSAIVILALLVLFSKKTVEKIRKVDEAYIVADSDVA